MLKHSSGDLERTVVSFCLSHNTTPSAIGAIPASQVFLKLPRTLLSATCTEFHSPAEAAKDAYVGIESKPMKVPDRMDARLGSNTFLDCKQRMVHESDIHPTEVPKPQSSTDFSPLSSPDPKIETFVPDLEEDVSTNPDLREPGLRRGTRARKPPDRLQYF